VTIARDGQSGIETAQVLAPDVVLCDIGLPGENDGYAVARTLRAHAPTAVTYLIALTGYGQVEDRERAREAGFDVHATKPIDPDKLLELLAQVSESARPL
jgi:CheY-like chemotaxis protein